MKKKKNKLTIGNFYSPYLESGDEMSAWFNRYMIDSDKFIEIDNKLFSKIIHRCEFYIYDDCTLLVSFEPRESLKIGDILVDEFGNTFTIKAFEMFRWTGNVPEWAYKVHSIAITGQDYTIGITWQRLFHSEIIYCILHRYYVRIEIDR